MTRLEEVFNLMGEKAQAKKCDAMEGLVKEGAETMQEEYEDLVMDSAIIGAAQRVEHYEIAAYGTVKEFARLLGEDEQVSLLEQTLEEEKQTDERLTQLAEEINSEAQEAGEGREEEGEKGEGKRRAKTSSRRAA